MSTLPASRKHLQLYVLAALILLYWFVRLHQLESLGFFLDEAAHTDWARLVWRLQPFHAASDGKWLNVLWIAAFWPLNAGGWIARASGLLISTCGFACLVAAAQQTFSFRTALFAGILYIFLPLAFFFERMALADPFSAAFVAGAVWTALRACKDTNLDVRWAVLCGAALAAGVLSKLTNLIFLCIPLLAVISIVSPADWRRGRKIAVSAYITAVLALLVPVLVLKYVGNSDMGFDLVTTRSGTLTFDQLVPLLQSFVTAVQAYLPFPIWPVTTVGVAAALWRGRRPTFFIFSVFLITLIILLWQSASNGVEPRYLLAYGPLWILLAATGLVGMTERGPFWITLLLAIATALPGMMFVETSWREPDQLTLMPGDRWQYITGWPSGYGFSDIAADIEQQSEPLKLVTLDLGGQQRLNGYLLGRNQFITPTIYKPGMDMTHAWLLLDRPKDDGDIARLNLNLIEIARYPRPSNESAIVVYRVEP